MAIEPEKEIVLILSEDSLTESIVSTIREALQIDELKCGFCVYAGREAGFMGCIDCVRLRT